MIDLINFIHDKKLRPEESLDRLKNTIDSFSNQSVLDDFYEHFDKNYGLDKKIVKHKLRRFLARHFNYKKSRGFSRIYSPLFILLFPVINCFLLLYCLIFSKKYNNQVKKFELLIYGIQSDREAHRFLKLINLFGEENVLIISQNQLQLEKNILVRPRYKKYNRDELIRVIKVEIFHGIFLYSKISAKIKFNIFPFLISLFQDYLYYFSIFNNYQSKFCINEKYYDLEPIQNSLFKRFNGISSSCIQKNIYHNNPKVGYYPYVDTFFVLGNKSGNRIKSCGGEIKELVPVGSLFMEYYMFGENIKFINKSKLQESYDIIYLGFNVGVFNKGKFINNHHGVYEKHWDDYYEHFKWLVNLSEDYPQLKIGIMHHLNHEWDPKELEIINSTKLVKMDDTHNSYKAAFNSKCVLTFASTMAYELIGHGKDTIFLDPERRNTEFLPSDSLIDPWRATTYNELYEKVNILLSGKDIDLMETKRDDLCINSKEVSENIYSYFNIMSNS